MDMTYTVGDPSLSPLTEEHAVAEKFCQPFPVLLDRLLKKFQERPFVIGRTGDGKTLVFLASQRGETWTLLLLDRDMMACVEFYGWDLKRLIFPEMGTPR